MPYVIKGTFGHLMTYSLGRFKEYKINDAPLIFKTKEAAIKAKSPGDKIIE